MPAAPSLEILLDTQRHFEEGLTAYYTINGVGPNYASRENVNMPDAHVDIQFQPLAATGHQATKTTSKTGWPEQDEFQCAFVATVNTDRPVDNGPVGGFKSKHDYEVAMLKKLMLRGAINGTISGITKLAVLYHEVVFLSFSSQILTVSDDTMDVTELTYNGTYRISPDAWPTPATP